MRFYLKLFAIIALFIAASRCVRSERFAHTVFILRTACVCAFGSPSDYESLIDDAHRRDSLKGGQAQLYYATKRAEQLFADRQTAAARMGICLSKEDLDYLRQECLFEAIADTPSAIRLEQEMRERAQGPSRYSANP